MDEGEATFRICHGISLSTSNFYRKTLEKIDCWALWASCTEIGKILWSLLLVQVLDIANFIVN